MKEKIELMRRQIASGFIGEVFAELQYITSKENRNSVIVLQSQYSTLNSQITSHQISFQEASLMKNQIVSSTLSLLDEIEQTEEPLTNIQEKETRKRTKFCLTIEGEFDDKTPAKVNKIIRRLVDFTSDENISIYNIKVGSIKIYLEADEDTYEKLNQLHKDGKLSGIIGFNVKELYVTNDVQNLISSLTREDTAPLELLHQLIKIKQIPLDEKQKKLWEMIYSFTPVKEMLATLEIDFSKFHEQRILLFTKIRKYVNLQDLETIHSQISFESMKNVLNKDMKNKQKVINRAKEITLL